MRINLFFKIAAYCLIATAITTLCIHLIQVDAQIPDERVLLFQNRIYIARNWITVLHCFMVILSMLGLGLLKVEESKGWISAGFIFYFIFSLMEICRMFTANILINGLRQQYYFSEDPAFKDQLRILLEHVWPLFGEQLFLIFIIAFALGNLCYGIAFFSTRPVGVLLLIWGGMNLIVFTNAFIQNNTIDEIMAFLSYTFQPLLRLILGFWMLKSFVVLSKNETKITYNDTSN